MTSPIIIVHGGAGNWPRNKHARALNGVRQAVENGFSILQENGYALDAVEQAIMTLENNPIFNAGTGSTMNLAGKIENDASIMDGTTLECGAVALVNGIKNPIKLARLIMEKTDHVLLAGKTARILANEFALEKADLRTSERLSIWRREKRTFEKGRSRTFERNSVLRASGVLGEIVDTVGALALDSHGRIAAGASTGGMTLKLPGRIGDTAVIGAGVYADNRLGAATATGIGELAIRMVLSKSACDLMQSETPQAASARVIRNANLRVGRGLGIIALDRKGRYGAAHSTRNLCWAKLDSEGSLEGMIGRCIV
jgi:beta-aspartyl-peptidase (threonine type)